MRPLELTLEGFKSYRRACTFDFESRTLFGIVGPTGSGKSSILEGLVFALYGKTPTVESGNKQLINSHEEQARVQLVFEADDVAWEVIRLIRQKGTSQTVLRRLDGDGDPVTGDRSVTERIEEIVGLDFESFRSSVSLPQGKFDRFLKATPTERSRILKGIFRLERVDALRDAAKGRWQQVDAQIAAHRSTLESFPEEPELLLEQLVAERLVAEGFLELVREELPKVLEAEQEVRRSAEEIERLQRDRSATEAALLRLPAEESLRNLADRHERAERQLADARDALLRAAYDLADAEVNERQMSVETGGDAWFTAVEAQLAVRTQLADALSAAERERTAQQRACATVEGQVPEMEKLFEAAETRLSDLRSQQHDLRQAHAAHLLRLDLSAGLPCPVCEQVVASVPKPASLPALAVMDEAVKHAEEEARSARASLEAATREHALALERVRHATESAKSAHSAMEGVERRLRELAPQVPDVPAEVVRRRAALEQARSALAEARGAREAADGTERKARQELDELAVAMRQVAHGLSHTAGLLGMRSVSPEGEGLWDAAKRVLEAGSMRLEELGGRATQLEEAARNAVELVESFRARFSASPEDLASDVLARAKGEVTRLELKIDEVQKGIEKRRKLQAEVDALVERRARFERLIADFTDSKFTAFLLDEQRRLLSRIGSEKFAELTGHYTFDDKGQFQIVDQRSGVTRSPETLSGGETFLASLSLALALSEAVALEGGRLGCFFLDEGFGSLDQESLDLALEGVENLAVPGRLIGLISHVPGVQARLDDLIVLERQADGSTEVAQHEGPIGYASALI
jgi:exonuclease SbcC